MKDGMIPAALGVIVTAGATAVRARDIKRRGMRQKELVPRVETAVLGFGIAHVVLGAIDLIQNS